MTLIGTRPTIIILDDIAADQHSTTERTSMTRVNKTIRLAPHDKDKSLNGRIILASVDTRQFLNLNVSDYSDLGKFVGLTLSPAQAKLLRDELLAIYPVEAKPVTSPPVTFKVGDKVRFKDNCPIGWWFGPKTIYKEGVIHDLTGAMYGGYKITVKIDSRINGGIGYVNAEHIELIEEAPKKDELGAFIVCLKEGADYKPSNRPVTHYTRSKAEAEAARLAKEHGGAFHVLKAVHVASRPTVTVPPVTARDL